MTINIFPSIESINLHPSKLEPIIGGRVELQLLTTLRCNLKCSYCSLSTGEVLGSQTEPTYSLDQLEVFVNTHLKGKEIYITFYGGEPTLNQKLMLEIMQKFPLFRFQLQTNGTLLHKLPDSILSKLSNILVSIDGGEKTTDEHRGQGIWKRVIKNIETVRDRIAGTVTARVTWGNPNTSFEELHELATAFKSVDYLYWQFVADEMYACDLMSMRRTVLSKLIAQFFSQTDKLYPLIPIMGIVRNKLFPNRAQELYNGRTQCRVSTHLINVMPDGSIFPCPDLMYMPDMQMGKIQENWLKASTLQMDPVMPCGRCEAYSWCRGNCLKNLYRAYIGANERYRLNVVQPICELIRFMGQEIERHDPSAWYAAAALPVKAELRGAEVYEYVEIMP